MAAGGSPAPDALHIHIDGGCRGNPGEAGYGVYVQDGSGAEVARLYGYLGVATNNVAEYQGLINGLLFALELGAARVHVFSDSELVVRQVEGRYKVKHPAMVPLHARAMELLRRFPRWTVEHVRRELNKEADALANRALDEKASGRLMAASRES